MSSLQDQVAYLRKAGVMPRPAPVPQSAPIGEVVAAVVGGMAANAEERKARVQIEKARDASYREAADKQQAALDAVCAAVEAQTDTLKEQGSKARDDMGELCDAVEKLCSTVEKQDNADVSAAVEKQTAALRASLDRVCKTVDQQGAALKSMTSDMVQLRGAFERGMSALVAIMSAPVEMEKVNGQVRAVRKVRG